MTLEIQRILRRLPGVDADRAVVTPIAAGLTNRNYRIDAPGGPYVLRIGGAHPELLGIDRRHEYAAALAAAATGVGPEVVAHFEDAAALVTRFITGAPITREGMTAGLVARIAESIRRIHRGPPIPGSFSAFGCVRDYAGRARDRGADLPPELDTALAELAGIEAAVGAPASSVPCHNDLLAANFIDDGTTVRIVDWEYAGMGDPRFDLANCAANLNLAPPAQAELLAAYGRAADPREAARIRLLRAVSDLRESTWGFLQTTASTLDVDYAAYGRDHLRRFRSIATDPAFPGLLRAARD